MTLRMGNKRFLFKTKYESNSVLPFEHQLRLNGGCV